MNARDERARFLSALERELRVTGDERARILEEIRGHLDEAADDAGIVARFGSPETLARRFEEIQATRSARRIVGRLAILGPLLLTTYLMSNLIGWIEVRRLIDEGIPPSSPRLLTPRLTGDFEVVNAVGTFFVLLGFVAVVFAAAAFAFALQPQALRSPAAAGLVAIILTGVAPLVAITYLATPQQSWPLAPVALAAATVVVLAVRNRDRRQTAFDLAVLATASFGAMILASVLMGVLRGLPAPTNGGSLVGYLQLALLPIFITTVVSARRARLLTGHR